MPNSAKTVRESSKIRPTPQDKGLVMDVRVVVYDNGLLEVDGVVVNKGDPGHAWLGATELIVLKLGLLRREQTKRERARRFCWHEGDVEFIEDGGEQT